MYEDDIYQSRYDPYLSAYLEKTCSHWNSKNKDCKSYSNTLEKLKNSETELPMGVDSLERFAAMLTYYRNYGAPLTYHD